MALPATVGAPILASDINSLYTSVTASVIRFRGTLAASTAVTATTNIAFAATEDPSAGWDATNKRWVVPSGGAGLYLISAQERCGSTAAVPICRVMVNGVEYALGLQPASQAAATSSITITKTLAVGDQISLQSINAYTATTSGDDNFLTVTRLGNS